ncbi:MAG: hypothetical protein Q6L50_11285 [Gloeomargarita sp. GMQP_bins_120]
MDQAVLYDPVDEWMKSHPGVPDYTGRRVVRNREWFHFDACDILLMPDKLGVSLVCRLGPCVSRGGRQHLGVGNHRLARPHS